MANIKNPIDQMLAAGGEGWEFVAVLGTDLQHHNSAYKLYLHKRNGGWWCCEDELPMMTARSEAPTRVYTESLLTIRGPVCRYPQWLLCHPGRAALVLAASACRSLSQYQPNPVECAA